MKYVLKKFVDPYILDYIEDENKNKFPALTLKNSKFIEGIIRLDSNYAQDYSETKKSTAYWFKLMSNHECDFSEFINGVVEEIDKINKTHLEASENGRIIMSKRIKEKCTDDENLKKLLEENFDYTNENHILSILTKKQKLYKMGKLDLIFHLLQNFVQLPLNI